MTDIEEALALLAAPCTDERFFQRALKALALVTQCRWAAFGRPSEIIGKAEVVAFCDLKHNVPGFELNLDGSPCEHIYQQRYPDTHLLYAKDLQTRFPNFQLIKDLGANSYQAELILDDDGNPVGHILVMDTLPQTESMKSKEFFRLLAQRIGVEYKRLLISRELALHKQMIAVTEHLMSFVDDSYTYHIVSKGYESLFNKLGKDIVGKTVEQVHGAQVFNEQLKPLIDRTLKGETIRTQEWIHPPHLTSPQYINILHNPYYNEKGQIVGVIVSAHNITDIHAAKEKSQHLANHDPLTGLLNRRALFEVMENKLRSQEMGQMQLAVLYIDLDGFQQINDQYGHHQGDEVLRYVAARIEDAAGDNEIVARIGGDEFIVLASLSHGALFEDYQLQVEDLCDRFSNQLFIDIDIKGQSLPMSASIGHYLVNDVNMDLSSIICKADKDMYDNKRNEKLEFISWKTAYIRQPPSQ
ncbi:GGDEF domain-containing protein [Shewanella sp. D64]|uniref:sensor domain-containing diguanylate cyclase n=1 Tax=unclassified Shewanella TaxID=196818 RepID=UPI0022BA3604|nr:MULTISPECIES: sensor domain-containing diguanylate cyclase [unclassified Shewanella]MEC4724869.1 GGDEF domain-containing protein [Shewanella sp. D64]MEC4736338.1 GGDEF domain-containing protein [Shewanella sp. E94]WBJ97601.1 GGDEF domain-containing protein [Shewanella sp. MTB7]